MAEPSKDVTHESAEHKKQKFDLRRAHRAAGTPKRTKRKHHHKRHRKHRRGGSLSKKSPSARVDTVHNTDDKVLDKSHHFTIHRATSLFRKYNEEPVKIPEDSRPIKILSIDGGGSRGVVALECLIALEEELQSKGLELWQAFDVVVGTSIGGCIAMMIGLLHMTAVEAQTFLYHLIPVAFPLKKYKVYKQMFRPSLYSTTVFIEFLENELFSHKIDNYTREKTTMKTFGSKVSAPKVFVTSVNDKTDEVVLIRSYSKPEKSPFLDLCDVPITTAALATSAAPTYFPAVELTDPETKDTYRLVDGAMRANNPTDLAVTEANLLFPNRQLGLVLSVGTGEFNTEPNAKVRKGWKWILRMPDIISDVKHTAKFMDVLAAQLGFENVRWQPILEEQLVLDTCDVPRLKNAMKKVESWMGIDDKAKIVAEKIAQLHFSKSK
mmetsp:Transcript_19751/g.21968  ORF Transcript_19751/g.21968 Transcript_19751/m.21968 type:complete len:437 (+) Transcript_19751:27-1337(+)